MKKLSRRVFPALVALAVAACGGPSETEVEELLKEEVRRGLEQQASGMRQFGNMMGVRRGMVDGTVSDIENLADEFEFDVSNVESVADREDVYRATVTTTFQGNSKTDQILLVETDSGLRLLEK